MDNFTKYIMFLVALVVVSGALKSAALGLGDATIGVFAALGFLGFLRANAIDETPPNDKG